MKRIIFILSILIVHQACFGQGRKYTFNAKGEAPKIDSNAAYLRTKKLPEFKLLLSAKNKDSVWFSDANIPANRPIIVIYFSPDCGHCQHEMREIIKNFDSLKKPFFVFCSFHPIDSIRAFATKYNLEKYPNMVMGRDVKYYIPVFFDVKFTPFVALYNTKKDFVTEYRQGIKMPELIQLIESMPVENELEKKRNKKGASN